MFRRFMLVVVALAITATWSVPTSASRLDKKALRRIGIDQPIDHPVPLDLPFKSGERDIVLSDVTGGKPTVLALVYNKCPMLCDQVLQGLVGSLRVLKLSAGTDFNVVAVSFDPEEDSATAADARTTFLRRYKRDGADDGVFFLTGKQPAITALTDAVGFRYEYDEDLQQYAHASAIMVLTPDGKVARYFFGTEYSPRDMRLSLREASDGKVGSVTDDLLLLCYRYDPESGTYSATVVNVIRLGGVITFFALALFIGRSLRRERKQEVEAP